METIVVCGLARCGTSMVMKMLHKGGIEPLCDPPSLGFGYELDDTLSLPGRTDWLDAATGKAVKILDPQILTPPKDRPYAFIFLERDAKQQAKSHVKFLKELGVPATRNDARAIEKSLRRDLPVAKSLVASFPESRVLTLRFENIVRDSLGAAADIDDFLQREDFDMLEAARAVIRRNSNCLPYMLELQMAGA